MARVIINWRPDGTEEYYDGPSVDEAVLNAAMDWHLSEVGETVAGALELIEVVGYEEVKHEWMEDENGEWLRNEAGWSSFKCVNCGAERLTRSVGNDLYSEFVKAPGHEGFLMSEGRKFAEMPQCRGSRD